MDSFRNNGYFRFSREDLYVEHDTVFAALIDPSLDPIEQAELLEKFKQKKENPTITVVIRQRPVRDSTHLQKFYIGDVTVFPDLPIGEDTTLVHTRYRRDQSYPVHQPDRQIQTPFHCKQYLFLSRAGFTNNRIISEPPTGSAISQHGNIII